MESPITTIIFDFGNVFVNWDARNLYKRFFPTLEAVDSFLEEIHFAEWNAHQDAGRPFKEGVADLSKAIPPVCRTHPSLRHSLDGQHNRNSA